jgi:NitT/TauT family transport system ATP-binding protein
MTREAAMTDAKARAPADRAAAGGTGVAAPLLEVRSLRKAYPLGGGGERLAIDDVSFEVSRGELVCVVGPSGAGKTTLLRCLAGLLPPSGGEALLEGEPIRSVPPAVGVVFQDYSRSLFPWFTVEKNVALALKVRKIPKPERQRRIAEVLSAVGLPDVAGRYPWQLSGGMQQRVAIARALAYRPELLFMDEPFASVDAQTRFELEDLVLRIQQEMPDVTVLFVTHDVDEAVYLADRVIVLSQPPARVERIVGITLPKPRDQMETRSDQRFGALRRTVLELVTGRSAGRPA